MSDMDVEEDEQVLLEVPGGFMASVHQHTAAQRARVKAGRTKLVRATDRERGMKKERKTWGRGGERP